MAASADPTYTVLAYLQEAGGDLTPQEVRQGTKLPLPVVARILQTQANELVPEVEREDLGGGHAVYRYIGPGLKAPPAQEAANSSGGTTKRKKAPARAPAQSTKAKGKATVTHIKGKAADDDARARDEVAPPSPEPAPRPQSPTPKAAPRTPATMRGVYDKIAEHLSVPMNITRLARATGLGSDDLRPALRSLIEAGLVEDREMMEDIVYRPLGNLTAKIAQIAAQEPSADAPTNAPIVDADLPEFLEGLRVKLEQRSTATQEALVQVETLAATIKQLAEETDSWRAVVDEAIDRTKAVLGQH